jgi:hypothetical protein
MSILRQALRELRAQQAPHVHTVSLVYPAGSERD